MFKFFSRRRHKPALMTGVFQRLGAAAERKQRIAADYLNSKTKDWTDRQILTGLLLLTVVLGGGAVVAVWKAFHQPARTVRIEPIRVREQGWKVPRGEPRETMLSNEAINNILAFRSYLDSLQQIVAGQKVYDSIVQYRAGLIDSLVFIEKVYQQQLKTSEDGKNK